MVIVLETGQQLVYISLIGFGVGSLSLSFLFSKDRELSVYLKE